VRPRGADAERSTPPGPFAVRCAPRAVCLRCSPYCDDAARPPGSSKPILGHPRAESGVDPQGDQGSELRKTTAERLGEAGSRPTPDPSAPTPISAGLTLWETIATIGVISVRFQTRNRDAPSIGKLGYRKLPASPFRAPRFEPGVCGLWSARAWSLTYGIG